MQSLLTFLSKIPNELLVEIFKLAIPTPIEILPDIDDSDLPWALFSVCKRWHQIVVGMPELWIKIKVDFDVSFAIPPLVDHTRKRRAEIVHKVLLRSGDELLSLSISCETSNMDDEKAQLLNLATLHAHRIRYLEIDLFPEAFSNLLILPLDLKCLEYLSLVCKGEVLEDPWSCTVFEDAAFKVASFNYCEEPFARPPTFLGPNLTYLSIIWNYVLSPMQVHEILEPCPNLIFLQIPISYDYGSLSGDDTNHIPQRCYPRLDTLVVNATQTKYRNKFSSR